MNLNQLVFKIISKKNILIIFSIIYCNLLFPQDKNNTNSSNLNIVLKIHPLPILNVGVPRLQGSIEFIIRNKFGIDLGYGKRYLDNNIWFEQTNDTLTVNPSGDIKIIDFNYYNLFPSMHKKKGNFTMDNYLGFSFKYIRDSQNKITKYWTKYSDVLRIDCYALKKTVYVYALKFGVIVKYKRIGAEGFGEFGLRYKDQYLVNSELDPDNDSYPNGFWPWERPYKGLQPHINIGIKLSYQIL